jgi:uncharacterized membrane protein
MMVCRFSLGLAAETKHLRRVEWSEGRLSKLPNRGGFRLRGESMTRIEVFSDAAFAFAVTMLVISLSSIPKDYEELVFAIKGIPSFAASFTVMMFIWVGHRRWSERFGLDDGVSTLLSLTLVFIVLVYVYPLKLIMDLLFYSFSQSWFPSRFQISSTTEVAGLVAFYSVGFSLIAAILWGLYWRAASKAKDLSLDRLEQLLVKKEQQIWLVQAVVGLTAATVAAIFMSSLGYLAGILFALGPFFVFIITHSTRKQIRAIQNK